MKSLRKNTEQVKEQIKKESSLKGGVAWFSIIGIYSITNTLLIVFSQKHFYSGGLGLNRVLISILSGVQQATGNNYYQLGLVLTFLLPLFFFWIYSKSKKKNKKAYLTGMIVLGIDTLLLVLYQSWFCIAFQIFGLWLLFSGYKVLIAEKKFRELEEKLN